MTFQKSNQPQQVNPLFDIQDRGSIYDDMISAREQLKDLIKQANNGNRKRRKNFKYGAEKSNALEVTFKDFLSLDPKLVRNATIVTGTSIDVSVTSPDWIECHNSKDKEDYLACNLMNAGGKVKELGNVLGISNFKNSSLNMDEDSFIVKSKGNGMRCVADNGMLLFCIGY